MNGSKKILLVEDSKSFAVEVEMMLEELGYDVLPTQRSASDALKLLTQEKPDLLLVDIVLEGTVDGITLASHIQDLHIPIIFVTAYNTGPRYDRARLMRPYAYLLKPFNLQMLQTTIDLALLHARNPVAVADQLLVEEIGDTLFVKGKNGTLIKLNVYEIYAVLSFGNYCHVEVQNERHTVRATLTNIADMLRPKGVLRIHKYHAVALRHIDYIDLKDNSVVVNGKSYSIGPTYKQDFIDNIPHL